MGTAEITGVTCKGCGAQRTLELTRTSVRLPCSNCGETAIQVSVTATSEVAVRASAEAALIPEVQERTWQRRWQDAQEHLDRLLTPRSEPLSAPAIHAAHADLQAFYIQTYHIKDSLKNASATTGVSPQTIEDEINHNCNLSLLADLANLDKHFRLSIDPRSGDAPKIVEVRGITRSGESSPEGWRLSVVIEHKGQRLDGLEVAKRSVSAWRNALQRWDLL